MLRQKKSYNIQLLAIKAFCDNYVLSHYTQSKLQLLYKIRGILLLAKHDCKPFFPNKRQKLSKQFN